MEIPGIALTAVYLHCPGGYVGFVEELPNLTCHGRTLEETRKTLKRMAAVVFEEERRETAALLEGRDVVRETFVLTLPPRR